MQHGNHIKQTLIIAAVILVGLLAFGVPTGSALVAAVLLACPIGMAAMMYFMSRDEQGENAHGHGGGHEHPDVPNPVRTQVGPRR
jgi:hypothetical protein